MINYQDSVRSPSINCLKSKYEFYKNNPNVQNRICLLECLVEIVLNENNIINNFQPVQPYAFLLQEYKNENPMELWDFFADYRIFGVSRAPKMMRADKEKLKSLMWKKGRNWLVKPIATLVYCATSEKVSPIYRKKALAVLEKLETKKSL